MSRAFEVFLRGDEAFFADFACQVPLALRALSVAWGF
jgi:hypothetical protein